MGAAFQRWHGFCLSFPVQAVNTNSGTANWLTGTNGMGVKGVFILARMLHTGGLFHVKLEALLAGTDVALPLWACRTKKNPARIVTSCRALDNYICWFI